MVFPKGARHTEATKNKISISMSLKPRRSHHAPGYVNWLTHNVCIHCGRTWCKGMLQCPECHLRLRTVPHKGRYDDIKRKLIKRAQVEAALLLKNNGWVLPPARVSAK